MVKKHSPRFVFLMETRAKDKFLKNLCRKLELKNLFIVPRNNTGGGLALYWKGGFNLNVLSSSPSHIDAVVDPRVDDAWRVISFYGNPVIANREHSWALLKHLSLQMDRP